ncbi:DNA translocase FtsK [Weissella coleopterorum]|uniref:DNA translocase FtsK n=1 Tax=Weissella coleopterorum TaxID=2714949 RepID=A0A6G8B0X6_9LACO|nr:DNA translocase FtsK [Weissella coleopterorum]QIL50958.1 DNA translocase FtsK [Weissella coleopterorum]
MASQRKTTKNTAKKKRKTSRKKQAETTKYTYHIIGIVGILAVITAIGKFGIVGAFLANITRWVVGDSYQLFLILTLVILGGLAVYGKMPAIKRHHLVGIGLLYMGITLMGSIQLFNHLNQHQQFLQRVAKLIEQDINNNLVRTPVGGGSLGAAILSLTYPALSNWGSWIIALVLVGSGAVVLFKLPIKTLMTGFFSATEYTANKVSDSTRTAVEISAKKMTAINEAYKERRSNIASEVFESDFEVKNSQSPTTKNAVETPFQNQPKQAVQGNPFAMDFEQQATPQSQVKSEAEFVMPEIIAPSGEPAVMQTVKAPGFNSVEHQIDPETGEILNSTMLSATGVTVDEPEHTLDNETHDLMQSTGIVSPSTEPPHISTDDASFSTEQIKASMETKAAIRDWEEDANDLPKAPDSEFKTGTDLAAELIANQPQSGDKNHIDTAAADSHVDLIRSAANYQASQHQTVAEEYHSTPEVGIDLNGFNQQISSKPYELPAVSLLTKAGSTDQSSEKSQLAEKSRVLQQTLESFNIKATVEKVVLGPTITQYEIKPAVGVKVSKITNLADDLAMALAAKSLRIEAPIPGKSLVGIEVANEKQAMVGFRNMFEQVGVNRNKILEVPIGKSVTGEIVKMDLTKMPHLLIAGSTGSGKSVAINTILAAILLQAKPSELRLMLVDPKKVELSIYNDIPHLITPVVSEPRKAAAALKKVVAEMDKRFDKLAEMGVRNLDGYNKAVDEHNAQGQSQLLSMPYLVVIIDELADLMITVAGEVEPAIVRIAQLGRAAGIHLIVATQRPSVDVITGLIKANVPSRMAFAVGSGTDSRTILDGNGAEKLLGRGDMLFKPIGANSAERVQGAFMSDDDVETLTDFIKKQSNAQYDENMEVTDADLKAVDGGGADPSNDQSMLDDMWDEALDFAAIEGEISASMMQRHFRMGYNRAARLVDDMEAQGVIGSATGGKRRPVLLTKEQWYARQGQS